MNTQPLPAGIETFFDWRDTLAGTPVNENEFLSGLEKHSREMSELIEAAFSTELKA